MKKIFLCLLAMTLLGCPNPDDDESPCANVLCLAPGIEFQIKSTNTSEDVFYNGIYAPGDLRITDIATGETADFFYSSDDVDRKVIYYLQEFDNVTTNRAYRIALLGGFDFTVSYGTIADNEAVCCPDTQFQDIEFQGVDFQILERPTSFEVIITD